MPRRRVQPADPAAPAAPPTPPGPYDPLLSAVDKKEAAQFQKLASKYRLDDVVRLDAVDENGQKMGKGPLFSPEAFERFASIDPTPDKRYLDWMLYQAGGGATAFKHSLEMWGEGAAEMTPSDFLRKFDREVQNRIGPNDVPAVVNRLRTNAEINVPGLVEFTQPLIAAGHLPTDQQRYNAIMEILNVNNIGTPDKRERVARELLSHKLKQWIRDQLDTKVRDRVHAVFIFNRLAAGMAPEQAEVEWKQNEPKRKREYVFGDQDSLKWMLFGFSRNWPGKDGRYEKVFNAMREFLVNKSRVENRNAKLAQYNAAIEQKNQALPPDQQIPLREPIDIATDIGKVGMDKKGHLKYKGPYETVDQLIRANDSMTDLPMRERVAGDIRYAGPKGKIGRGEKIYSDQFVDARVPITVAAAVKGGHESWPISDPAQLDVKARGGHGMSTWTRWAAGEHHHHEWAESQIIPVFFDIKNEQGQVVYKIMLMLFLSDLVQLEYPYLGTLWRLQDDDEEIRFTQMMERMRNKLGDQSNRVVAGAIKGIHRALRVLRQWGQEFEPKFVVGDYMKYHREKMGIRRGLKEEIQERARQVVELIIG